MEDIEEKPQLDDHLEEDEEDQEKELNKVSTVESKMGAEETQIREALAKVYMDKFGEEGPEEDLEDADMDAQNIELADKMYAALKDQKLGEWNVIVGNRFSLCIALLKPERFASFKIARINVLVFELK